MKWNVNDVWIVQRLKCTKWGKRRKLDVVKIQRKHDNDRTSYDKGAKLGKYVNNLGLWWVLFVFKLHNMTCNMFSIFLISSPVSFLVSFIAPHLVPSNLLANAMHCYGATMTSLIDIECVSFSNYHLLKNGEQFSWLSLKWHCKILIRFFLQSHMHYLFYFVRAMHCSKQYLLNV